MPHIQADDVDGAVWGMGYCHALDRGMQMGLMRVLSKGRLCECFDDSDASLATDVFFRLMNWAGQMKTHVEALDDDTCSLIKSYCEGVNARFIEAQPWEFRLLGYQPEPWTEDCLILARMTGYLTLAQSQAEIERLFVELAQGGIDDEKLVHLFQGCFENSAFEHVSREILQQEKMDERLVPSDLKWLAAPRAMASNNWVVSAKKSKTGNALVSNDPHLEVNRLPNVGVEQVVELPNDTFYCANMPGLPAPLVGRNQSLSWGATYTFLDAVDTWVEHCKDGTFRQGGDDENATRENFSQRKEVIQRKKKCCF
ncbi:MAG: penicillin acylase family protein [Deltaproteobacteria bacterium]|nr:penicillin acylase family protein [Deltaproteobacteria bacterium]